MIITKRGKYGLKPIQFICKCGCEFNADVYEVGKDITLMDYHTRVRNKSEAKEICDKFEEKYKDKIVDRAFIEDEINDMILVDREYLDLYEQITRTKA